MDENAERKAKLKAAMERLPPKALMALILARKEGNTFEEIGKRMQVSRRTARRLVTAAFDSCQQAVAKQ